MDGGQGQIIHTTCIFPIAMRFKPWHIDCMETGKLTSGENEMAKSAQELIDAMDDMLNNSTTYTPKSLNEYWGQSASASVINDYKKGNVRNVKC